MANPVSITLADYLHRPCSTIEKGIVQRMRERSPLLDHLKFVTENRLAFHNYLGPSQVEGGTWKKIGEHFDEGVQFDYTPINETTYKIGREFVIPEDLEGVADNTIEDPVKANIEYYTEGIHRQVANAVINGKSTDNDGNSFVGIRERLAKLPTEQTIQAVDTSHYLDLRVSESDYAPNVETFIVLMNKLNKAIDGGKPDFYIVNEDFQIKFESILRTSGLLTTVKDSFDREIPAFKGVPFIDAGRCEDDSTYIISNTETITGGDGISGTDYGTSIYAVKCDTSHLVMLEKTPFRVRDNFNDTHMIYHRYILDWSLGMMITHPRSVARIQGLRMN